MKKTTSILAEGFLTSLGAYSLALIIAFSLELDLNNKMEAFGYAWLTGMGTTYPIYFLLGISISVIKKFINIRLFMRVLLFVMLSGIFLMLLNVFNFEFNELNFHIVYLLILCSLFLHLIAFKRIISREVRKNGEENYIG